jgi:hypothetical protein
VSKIRFSAVEQSESDRLLVVGDKSEFSLAAYSGETGQYFRLDYASLGKAAYIDPGSNGAFEAQSRMLSSHSFT